MTKTFLAVILVMLTWGCATSISATEKRVAAREDARDQAMWKVMVTGK